MARLYRFVKLHDRFDTQVFTFALPNKLIKEYSPEVYGKDFVYGYQKWNVGFTKSDIHLGAYLKLQTASRGMTVNIDFTFTILNKEHFTKNESFSEKSCDFNVEQDTNGRQAFIALGDLVNRNFMQESGEFLIELELRSCLSTFQCYLRMAKDHQSRYSYGPRLETPYFSFGLFDWSVSLFPNASTVETEGNVAIQLHRHTSFDHLCNLHYEVSLGDDGIFDSGELEQLLDLTGNGDPYIVGSSLSYLARGRAAIKVVVQMFSVVSVSEVTLHVLSRNRNRCHCYDRDKQAWMLEADTSGKCLSFRLYYTDISHVPRKYTRYVCWNLNVTPRTSSERPLKAINSPYYKYYVQQDLDEGFEMKTDIPVEELNDPDSSFLDPEDHKLNVHIEWIDSHLLVCPNYHSLDDVSRLHKHQMWREILALQAENYALEKQLYSYQQSIAKTNSKDKPEQEKVENYISKGRRY